MDQFFAAHPVSRWSLVVLLAAAVVVALGRILDRRARGVRNRVGGTYATDLPSEWGHAVMAAAMLLMLTVEISNTLWRGIFALTAVFYLGLLIDRVRRSRAGTDARSFEPAVAAGYHAVAAAAMIYAGLGHPARHSMAHHPGMAEPQGLPAPVLGMVLAALFALDALGVTIVAFTLRREDRNLVRDPRIGMFPHVAMDIGMVAMLLAAL